MARIVLGLATSHTPMASAPAELWEAHGQVFDMRQKQLLGHDGEFYDFPGLLAKAPPQFAEKAQAKHHQAMFDRCQVSIGRLAELYAEAAPDVAIIVGEDQHEHFFETLMPALMVFAAETTPFSPLKGPPNPPPTIAASRWAYGLGTGTYPIAHDLAHHLIKTMIAREFDVAVSKRLPGPAGIGHAFSFIYQRIMDAKVPPHVPVFLNTYYPPNVPTPSRAFAIGKAIRAAVESWPENIRVAVIASGGLSHVVVNEEIDLQALDAMKAHDEEAIAAIPASQMKAGTSEILNWIAASGALGGLDMEVLDYVPAYRSPAGTGVGMAFAAWR